MQPSSMRPSKKDILIWVLCRKVMTSFAKAAANTSTLAEYQRFRQALIAELEVIEPSSFALNGELWKQAVAGMLDETEDETQKGLRAYALERLGLLPEPEEGAG